MQIPIDVEVQCTDGEAGRTAAIIVDPATRQVTHVVVKGKGTLLGEFLVPVDRSTRRHPSTLILRWSRVEAGGGAPF